jgi:hypothetical protein
VKGRLPTITFALVSAILFAMSVWGGRWWSLGEIEIGPFGASRCFSGECEPAGLSWVGGGERWMRTGTATWAAGMIAMFMLIVVAGALAAKRVPRLAAKTSIVAVATAAATGGMFVAWFPSERVPVAIVGRGLWMFVAAIALGAIASILTLRTKKL